MSGELTSQKTVLPDSWFGEMSALMRLGVPMALTQLVHYSIYFVDMVMIGRISPEDVAAAGLGGVVVFLLWMLASGPTNAVSPMVSQALGANQNDTRDARRSVRMSLWVIACMIPFIIVIIFLAEPIMLALGQDPHISGKAKAYIYALGLGLPFSLATMSLRNFLAALDKTFIPFLIIVATIILNVALNTILIFGLLGFPRLELIGAGLASSLSAIAGFFIFVLYINTDKRARTFNVFKNIFKADWERFREIIRLGWPISMASTFEGMLFNAGLLVIGLIGVMQQAAYQIALNVASCAFMMPWGMSMAGGVRIGLARGAGNTAAERRAASTTVVAALIAIAIFAIPTALFPEKIAALYLSMEAPENQEVITYIVLFLPIAAAFTIFDAVQVACNQLLRGLKDVNIAMWITGVSYWVIGFPTAYYLGLHSSLGAVGVWYGLMLSLFCAALGLGIRLRQQLAHQTA